VTIVTNRSTDLRTPFHSWENEKKKKRTREKGIKSKDIQSKNEINKKKQQIRQAHTKHQRNATFNKTTNEKCDKINTNQNPIKKNHTRSNQTCRISTSPGPCGIFVKRDRLPERGVLVLGATFESELLATDGEPRPRSCTGIGAGAQAASRGPDGGEAVLRTPLLPPWYRFGRLAS
jgi:hypothetical protein